jgi:hypothetical protein
MPVSTTWDGKKKLKSGSKTADIFMTKHKRGPKNAYCMDLDCVIYDFKNRIIAVVDHKHIKRRHNLTSGEVTVYDQMLEMGIPVFIVATNDDVTSLSVYQYLGAHPRKRWPSYKKPSFDLDVVFEDSDWNDYWKWEMGLRRSVAVERGGIGENNHNAHISEHDVDMIRYLYGDGDDLTQQDIADLFGISRQQVSKIVRKEMWNHV